jgi:hypothetical protein
MFAVPKLLISFALAVRINKMPADFIKMLMSFCGMDTGRFLKTVELVHI